MKNIVKDFAELCRRERAGLRISQGDLAEKASVSLKSISNIENEKKVKDSTIEKVAKTLGFRIVEKYDFVKITQDEDEY